MTPQVSTPRERNTSIDIIKILAMVLVITMHTVQSSVGMCGGIPSYAYRSCVVAVPLFFMVSGFLLLGRIHPEGDVAYSRRRFLNMFRLSVVVVSCEWLCVILFDLPRHTAGGIVVEWVDLLGSAYMQLNETYVGWVLWFILSLMIIQLLYPWLNSLYKRNLQAFARLAIVFGIVSVTIFVSNVWYYNITNRMWLTAVQQALRLWTWIFYFMLGGVMSKYITRIKIPCLWWWLLVGMFAMINIFIQVSHLILGYEQYQEYFYDSPTTIAFVLVVFIAICKTKFKRTKIINTLSRLFLAIYILHMVCRLVLVQAPVQDYLQTLPHTLAFGISLTYMLVASLALSWLAMKIPFLRTIFRL